MRAAAQYAAAGQLSGLSTNTQAAIRVERNRQAFPKPQGQPTGSRSSHEKPKNSDKN